MLIFMPSLWSNREGTRWPYVFMYSYSKRLFRFVVKTWSLNLQKLREDHRHHQWIVCLGPSWNLERKSLLWIRSSACCHSLYRPRNHGQRMEWRHSSRAPTFSNAGICWVFQTFAARSCPTNSVSCVKNTAPLNIYPWLLMLEQVAHRRNDVVSYSVFLFGLSSTL